VFPLLSVSMNLKTIRDSSDNVNDTMYMTHNRIHLGCITRLSLCGTIAGA